MTATDSRTIVVTGVTRGLGRALLARFHAAGHRVAGCARSREGIAALREALPGAELASVDVSDAPGVLAWAEDVLARLGPPDLLVNNAALMNRPAPLWEVPAEEFDALLAVNVGGTANVVRAFVPAMVARARGVIVNLSSGWGRSTSPEVGPYCTTKWAIEGFTGALAQELPTPLGRTANPSGRMVATEDWRRLLDPQRIRQQCRSDGVLRDAAWCVETGRSGVRRYQTSMADITQPAQSCNPRDARRCCDPEGQTPLSSGVAPLAEGGSLTLHTSCGDQRNGKPEYPSRWYARTR